MNADLTCDKLLIDIKSGGRLNIKGTANDMLINSKGGGVLNGKAFVTQQCHALAGGNSNLSLNVINNLNATAINYSKIFYRVGLKSLTKNIKQNGVIKSI